MSGVYKTYDEVRTERIERRRRAAEAVLRRAAGAACARGARLMVFGSFVEGGFHERSDLDVALFDASPGADLDIAAQVDALLREAGFDVDVVPERFMTPSLRERILGNGAEYGPLGRR